MRRLANHPLLSALLPCLLLSIWSVSGEGAVRQETVASELSRLHKEDQADRRAGVRGETLRQRDRDRRKRVAELLAKDLITSPEDRYHAALILQHSTESEDILKAHALAMAAAFGGHDRARWLAAASLDRYLVYEDRAQFFGTQFERDADGAWRPGSFDDALTPTLREAFELPSTEELQERAEAWN